MWIIRPPIYTLAQKVFYNTCVCVRVHLHICARTHTCLCIAYTEMFFTPFEGDIRVVCAHRCALFAEKQTRIPFLMRTGAKVFYNVGEDTRIYSSTYSLCCKTDFNVSRYPLCANRTGRARRATLIATRR